MNLLFVLCAASAIAAIAADFDEQELKVIADDGVEMGATLTIPSARVRPKAAIVLATGSGIQNRDEEVMGKTPFKTLAEFLSGAGYAVLRVDDRGFANSADAARATVDTDMSDVASAVAVADALYDDIPVGIIGHSYGGNSAISNAVANPHVDFIVTLAATAWSGDSLIMSQSRTLSMQATGKWDGEELQRKLMSIAKSDLPNIPARMALMLAMNEAIGEASKLPMVQKQVESQINPLLSPWYRSMLRYDPAADIAKVEVPWLALNGSKDTQVLPDNLKTIEKLNTKADTHILEGHNHLFQQCVTGLPQEYATISGDISTETLSIILDWLEKTIGKQ